MPSPQPSKKVEPGKSRARKQPAPEPSPTRFETRDITDPKAMRALAHPVRWALLEAIRRDGEITATRAAELLGESPGNMSWHLQTLAKYGFVEEVPGSQGRSRPWRAVARSTRFDTSIPDPEAAAAGEALEHAFMDRNFQQMDDWRAQRHAYPMEWRQAAFITNTITYLTHEELDAMAVEVREVFARYVDRRDRKNRPEGALPVHLLAYGHPVPPTPSGN